MECLKHLGREMIEIVEDLPACPTCGNNPPPRVVGYQCHMNVSERYDLDGRLIEEPRPEAEALAEKTLVAEPAAPVEVEFPKALIELEDDVSSSSRTTSKAKKK